MEPLLPYFPGFVDRSPGRVETRVRALFLTPATRQNLYFLADITPPEGIETHVG